MNADHAPGGWLSVKPPSEAPGKTGKEARRNRLAAPEEG
jgi:hypothetical protein